MSSGDVLMLALVVIVPAALMWAIFLARSGRPGRGPRPHIGIPQALRPGEPDERLEGPRLERIMVGGVLTTISLAIFVPIYWLPEADRQASFQERFDEESLHRGELIFAAPPTLPENAPASEYKELERSISLGMNCALCHGNEAGGGTTQRVDPASGEELVWQAPPLNTVFHRWDEEIVKFTIERGRPGTPMPAWGVEFGGPMTEQMVQDVMAWLKSIQLPPPELAEACNDALADDALSCSSGKEIFEARCAVCHGIRGEGREAEGTLDDPVKQGLALWKGDVKHLNKDWHRYTIRNGRRFAFMPAFAEAPVQGIPIPPYPLTDKQIEAVLEYERTL
ncbi:MAG TPA: c-type cytochrome [Actinomycetota bacterium]|nr:c-type cytochrome [Actinomycetota bacterium]